MKEVYRRIGNEVDDKVIEKMVLKISENGELDFDQFKKMMLNIQNND